MGSVANIVLPIALAFIMFTLGLGLTFNDFARVLRRPRDFALGAFSQIIILPAVAFAIISLWDLPKEIALGVMIIAAAPGGVTSNLLTSFARGDVALSISLTAVISLLSVLTVPLIVVFAYTQIMGQEALGDVTVTKTAVGIFVIVVVPVVTGLLVRLYTPNVAKRFDSVLRLLSAFLFALVLFGAIYQERNNFVTYFAQAGTVTLVLNVVMLTIAYILGSFLASGSKQKIAISLECGLQNGTLAIAVATMLFGGGATVIPAATYSLIMFATALLFVCFLRLSNSTR
ncbi:MAG: bile acid:sodium symporter family protein [Pseudomonadota bacterium]|nr:bile acid:sodium symporter family protein [Pseudomonadota bacterium]